MAIPVIFIILGFRDGQAVVGIDLGHDDACVGVVGVSLWWCDPQFSLAVQKQTSVMEQPFRDRI